MIGLRVSVCLATGVAEDGFYGALDIRSGNAYLFMPRLPESFAVWFGEMPTPATVKAKYAVQVRYEGLSSHPVTASYQTYTSASRAVGASAAIIAGHIAR